MAVPMRMRMPMPILMPRCAIFRYLHNLRTSGFDSESNCMHVNASVGTKTGDPLTFAVPLQQAGYATGVYGKYLNSGGMEKICAAPTGDGSMLVPAGWGDYMGACPDTVSSIHTPSAATATAGAATATAPHCDRIGGHDRARWAR